MGFKCGIVGLPNVGKSALFNALTESNNAEVANYPFATIEPNIGRVPVPDKRLKKLTEISASKKTIPSYMDFVDIAGLVKGASTGEGLGNKFLSHIREMNVLIHVVRCFENTNITHTSPSINPSDDIKMVETELRLADIETVENKIYDLQKRAKSGDKKIKTQESVAIALLERLNHFQNLNARDSSEKEIQMMNDLNLLTIKPMLYVCNVDEKSILTGNHLSNPVKEKCKKDGNQLALVSALIESQITQLENEKDKLELLNELQLQKTTLNNIIHLGYNLLNLITFFASKPKETRAWTVKNNTKASQAAGKIHSDFEKGFIKAETTSYEDFIRFKGEAGCREAGKLRQEGKDYIVQDGDVFNFLFNV